MSSSSSSSPSSSVPGGDISMSDLATPSVPSLVSSSSVNEDISIDVDTVASRYKLYGRIHRLYYIYNNSAINRKRAFELMIDTIKKDTLDTVLYRSLYQKENSKELGINEYSYSPEWVDQAEKIIQSRQNSLEKDISFHTNSQIRENIRVSITNYCRIDMVEGKKEV